MFYDRNCLFLEDFHLDSSDKGNESSFHPVDFPVAQYLGRSREHVRLSLGLSNTVKIKAFLKEKE